MSNIIPENVKVPKEAHFYSPAPNIIFFGKGKSAQRFIFRDQELTPFENEKLTRLELELKKSNISLYKLHPNWDRKDVLRFCYGTGWKTRVAKEVVVKYLKWRQDMMPNGYLSLFPKVSKILESGCVYIHGRDMHYRPILVINFNKFNLKKFAVQEYIYMIGFILDFVIENMLLPGRVENWVVISDFEKNGFGELGFGSLKQVMGILTDNYRCRLGCNYVVNPAKIVYYMWSCMKPFLDDVLIEKVKILNKPHPEELFSHCNPYQVEEKYGGKAKNVQIFWPPILPNAPYTINGIPFQMAEEGGEKSFESQLNVVEENDFSPKRRSLSINGAFEVKVDVEVEDSEEKEKRVKKERRRLRRMKKEMKRREREENEENEGNEGFEFEEFKVLEKKDRKSKGEREEGVVLGGKKIGREEVVMEQGFRDVQEGEWEEGKERDSDFEIMDKSPVGMYIPAENNGTTFESNKADVGCNMCSIPQLPSETRCSLF